MLKRPQIFLIFDTSNKFRCQLNLVSFPSSIFVYQCQHYFLPSKFKFIYPFCQQHLNCKEEKRNDILLVFIVD